MYGHLIFSTQGHVEYLDDKIRVRVHSYMATLLRNMNCSYVHVGGTEDHVHILFDLGKTDLPVNIIGKVKKESSKFIKTLGKNYEDFYWQGGYGLFSVSPSSKVKVADYISSQIEHHKKMSFKEEFLAYLKKYTLLV
ncbi:MAG: transposase [Victivallaceae bacterium]|nr:transposase [Victivallaceae bacterium]